MIGSSKGQMIIAGKSNYQVFGSGQDEIVLLFR
jgi:hypothetical protein